MIHGIPLFLSHLPIDERGYPIPFFVSYVAAGKPDFRTADPRKWWRCVKEELCWVCGKGLGELKTFVIGPMCAINRTTGEPPCHAACAQWSVCNCPFLAEPKRKRNFVNLPAGHCPAAGIPIDRNPGVSLVWMTKSFKLFKVEEGRYLIQVGPPQKVHWYQHGREATREEVLDSIKSGLPLLEAIAEEDGYEAVCELRSARAGIDHLLPA